MIELADELDRAFGLPGIGAVLIEDALLLASDPTRVGEPDILWNTLREAVRALNLKIGRASR